MTDRIIHEVHDLEICMAEVLANTAHYDADVDGYVPHFLWSDFALDVEDITKPENVGVPFLWHVHNAGTYMHFLNVDAAMESPTYESWKERFLKFKDWNFEELEYHWACMNHPMDRIYYYDGHKFRQVSRDTALLIWQYAGKEIIRRHEQLAVDKTA